MTETPVSIPLSNLSPGSDLAQYYALFRSRLYAAAFDLLLLAPILFLIQKLFVIEDKEALRLALIGFQQGKISFGEVLAIRQQIYFSSGEFQFDLVINIICITFLVLLLSKYGATPGKKILGIKVVDEKTLQNLSKKQAFIRSLAYFASILPLMIGFMMIAFSKKHQGLHDKIAGTVVLYTMPRDAAYKEREFRRNTVIAIGFIIFTAILWLIRSQQ